MKKIILGLAIVLVLSFCVAGSVDAISAEEGAALIKSYEASGTPYVTYGQGASCTDTDGGKQAYRKGTVCIGGGQTSSSPLVSKESSAPYCKTDHCVSQNKLVEYYCWYANQSYEYGVKDIQPVIFETVTSCRYGCENGACLRQAPSYTEGLGTEDPVETEHPVGLECIPDNGILCTFASVKGECCEGLHEIASGYRNGVSYCTSEVCGNGECKALENKYNCPEDCAEPTPVSGLQPAIDMVKQLIQDLNTLLGLLTSLSN